MHRTTDASNTPTQPPPRPAFLQRSNPLTVPSVMQQAKGRLIIDADGCILLKETSVSLLIIWPPQASIRPGGFSTVDIGQTTVKIGDTIMLGGSGSGPVAFTSFGTVRVPKPCKQYGSFIVDDNGVTFISGE